MKEVTLLKDGGDGVRGNRGVFLAHDRFVDLRIEGHTCLIDRPQTVSGEGVEQLLIDQLKSPFVVLVLRLTVRGQRVLESVDDRDKRLDQPSSSPLVVFRAFPTERAEL